MSVGSILNLTCKILLLESSIYRIFTIKVPSSNNCLPTNKCPSLQKKNFYSNKILLPLKLLPSIQSDSKRTKDYTYLIRNYLNEGTRTTTMGLHIAWLTNIPRWVIFRPVIEFSKGLLQSVELLLSHDFCESSKKQCEIV